MWMLYTLIFTHILFYFRMYNFLGDYSSTSKRKTFQNVEKYFLKYFSLSSNNSNSYIFFFNTATITN